MNAKLIINQLSAIQGEVEQATQNLCDMINKIDDTEIIEYLEEHAEQLAQVDVDMQRTVNTLVEMRIK